MTIGGWGTFGLCYCCLLFWHCFFTAKGFILPVWCTIHHGLILITQFWLSCFSGNSQRVHKFLTLCIFTSRCVWLNRWADDLTRYYTEDYTRKFSSVLCIFASRCMWLNRWADRQCTRQFIYFPHFQDSPFPYEVWLPWNLILYISKFRMLDGRGSSCSCATLPAGVCDSKGELNDLTR